MDVKYVNPFIVALHETFRTMIKVEVETLKPKLKTYPYPTYDISGIIGLSGDATGSIAISFPKLVALRVVSAMLGTEIKIIGSEVSDAIGELANIIAGNAKKDLTEFHLTISLPNVIVGKNHTITSQTGIDTILVPFHCQFGDFVMEVALKTK